MTESHTCTRTILVETFSKPWSLRDNSGWCMVSADCSRTSQGSCLVNLHRWGLAKSAVCACSDHSDGSQTDIYWALVTKYSTPQSVRENL